MTCNIDPLGLTIVSYGGGTNSTALLIECAKRGIKIDLILFADTGGERPHTYNYVKILSDWLVNHGMPEIITVKKVDKNGDVLTLEDNCLAKNMLPAIAYGFKTCSQKYKIQPQDKYVNNWPTAKSHWKAGGKITKLIGYDAGEWHRAENAPSDEENKKYNYRYPLIDWDITREKCIEIILSEGLCLPGKSACYYCPNSSISEIKQLAAVYPELADRAVAMEQNADLHTIKGLGRGSFSWKDVLATDDMFSEEFSFTPEMSCDCYDG